MQYTTDAEVYKERYPKAKMICPEPCVEKLKEQEMRIDSTVEETFKKGNQYGIKVHKPPLKKKYTEYIYEVPLSNGEKALICNEIILNVDQNVKRNFLFKILNYFYDVEGNGEDPHISYGYRKVTHTSSFDLINFWVDFAQYITFSYKSSHPITVATVSHSKEIVGDLDSKFRNLSRKI